MFRTAKELMRRFLYRCGLGKLDVRFRVLKGRNLKHLYLTSLEERFSAIYKNQVWLCGRPTGSLSGRGSNLENTLYIRQGLPGILSELGTQTLLDLGCGDFGWLKEVELPCKYLGVDIVPHLIQENTALYGSEKRAFEQLDATRSPLPKADTVLCREVLFHLSFQDVWSVIDNLHNSRIGYLIATTDREWKVNADILSGDYRPINLHQPPWNFPAPLKTIADNAIDRGRMLAVWEVSSLPRSPGR